MGAEPWQHDAALVTDAASGSPDAPADLLPFDPAEEQELLAKLSGLPVFMAGLANVIMQLSWPEVGYGVMESKVYSGQVMRHPFKRFRTTIGFLDVALNGTEEFKAEYRAAINKQHRQVRSGPDSPVRYNAFNRDLQLWVASCLYYGVRDSYLGHNALTEREEEVLLRACGKFGTMLQVPADMWHPDRATFEAYWADGLERIRIDPPVRDYLHQLLWSEFLHFPAKQLIGRPMAWVNIGFLPEPFRREMGISWSDADERRFRGLLRLVAVTQRPLPAFLRRMPLNLMSADLRLRHRLGRPLT